MVLQVFLSLWVFIINDKEGSCSRILDSEVKGLDFHFEQVTLARMENVFIGSRVGHRKTIQQNSVIIWERDAGFLE